MKCPGLPVIALGRPLGTLPGKLAKSLNSQPFQIDGKKPCQTLREKYVFTTCQDFLIGTVPSILIITNWKFGEPMFYHVYNSH